MIDWDAARVAAATGAVSIRDRGEVEESDGFAGPRRVTIDSRAVQPGDLFVGLPGERVDGGSFAERALGAGAWGVLVAPPHAARAAAAGGGGAILAHPDPLLALQTLARTWRRALGAKVVAITGSTGKTSTKDILAALLASHLRTAASPQNLNTEIGLPLALLAALPGTEALVLEMAMRGPGQIAELVAIAEPDVGVIVNVGPVHLELLGSIEAIAAAKAELIAGLAPGATVVIPAREPLLAPHLRADLHTVTFGAGGDYELAASRTAGDVTIVAHAQGAPLAGSSPAGSPPAGSPPAGSPPAGSPARPPPAASASRTILMRPSFSQSHNLRNLLAAVAAARALGVTPEGKLDVVFSALRGERVALADGIVLINDCYNANPMSMRAALDDLAASAPARRVAVLGDMLELGAEQGPALHREVAAHARARGVELLVTVGPQAAAMGESFAGEAHAVADAAEAAALLAGLLRAEDTVLVKGSRGVGLELVAERLAGAR
ncbi:MAG TPA: UDP-N-acetylmuramoyl-tripeptide--D-alanyl-D-alanine ligase [Solirubrobacteraceae bacterium]|nr:UDP-N-acetylmuramoyl-tripeptide--D-alanyl-D-alanine ligase [Solirubrobacteraceae bacterium]